MSGRGYPEKKGSHDRQEDRVASDDEEVQRHGSCAHLEAGIVKIRLRELRFIRHFCLLLPPSVQSILGSGMLSTTNECRAVGLMGRRLKAHRGTPLRGCI